MNPALYHNETGTGIEPNSKDLAQSTTSVDKALDVIGQDLRLQPEVARPKFP